LPLTPSLRRDLYQRVYMYADRQPRSLAGRALARGMWGALPPSPLGDPLPRAAEPSFDGLSCGGALALALNHDQRTYLHHLSLKRADAMGMAHSVELRVPYLGREIVELAATIPPAFLLKGGVEKHILRRALAPLLPRAIVERRKRPFQMALDRGLLATLDLLCDRLLRPADVKARGFFDPGLLGDLRSGRPGRRAPAIAHKVWSYRLWSVILCELWARIFIDRPADAGPPACLDDVA